MVLSLENALFLSLPGVPYSLQVIQLGRNTIGCNLHYSKDMITV